MPEFSVLSAQTHLLLFYILHTFNVANNAQSDAPAVVAVALNSLQFNDVIGILDRSGMIV